MKYLQITFHITPLSTDAADLVMALSASCGLESFLADETEALTGYVQENAFDQEALEEVLSCFPMPETKVTFSIAAAEDKNWNEEWEQNGFEPVLINNKILIHSTYHHDLPQAEYHIIINPEQAFGTGSHDTTSMIMGRLLDMDLTGKKVLDAGCGTGILGIFASMQGASEVMGYDIDNWSVRNSLKNLELNGITNMQILEGDAGILSARHNAFDLVLANINKNILLHDMPSFTQCMAPNAEIIFSGFYTADAEDIKTKAQSLGLQYIDATERNDWMSLRFILLPHLPA